jgi:hypothetical protein
MLAAAVALVRTDLFAEFDAIHPTEPAIAVSVVFTPFGCVVMLTLRTLPNVTSHIRIGFPVRCSRNY